MRPGESWENFELRRSIVDPTSEFMNYNPHYERTSRTFPAGASLVGPSRWRCTYCGGSRAADLDNCPGCGAGRM